jgi:hypothetical protein
MKQKYSPLEIILLLLACLMIGSCQTKMTNPNIRPDRQQQQFRADHADCLAYAYGQIPPQQIHINSKGNTNLSGTFTGFDSTGVAYSGVYNEYTQHNNPGAYWADMANMTSSLATSLARDKAVWRCMAAKGWKEQSKDQEQFWNHLNERQPKWVDIENDFDFNTWLHDNHLKDKYLNAVKNYDYETVIVMMDTWKNEVNDINIFLKSKQFQQWVQGQPHFFQQIAVSGKPHQKKALVSHYHLVTTHEGIYEVPKDAGLKILGIWSAGMEAFVKKKDYAEAFYFFGGLAVWDKAIPKYFELASMALIGLGETDRAFLWDIKAAEKGLADSQLSVGVSYLNGDRMAEKNHELAFKYLFASAEQGDPMAQHYLSLLYWNDKDRFSPKKIYYYSMVSALQGDSGGQASYSACYEDGIFIPKNYYEAYKWAVIAQANGEKIAGNATQRLELKLTKHEISKAQQEAAQYIEMQRERPFDKANIVTLYQPYSDIAHVSYTTIPMKKYAQIMSVLHDKSHYEIFAIVDTNRTERLYSDIKTVLSKYKIGPATFKVDKSTLQQRLNNILSKSEKAEYNPI